MSTRSRAIGLHPSPSDNRDWALLAFPLAEELPPDYASLKHYSGCKEVSP